MLNPFGCEMHGTYRLMAISEDSACAPMAKIVSYAHRRTGLDCSVRFTAPEYEAELQCNAEDDVAQSCAGTFISGACSYSVTVDLCPEDACQQ